MDQAQPEVSITTGRVRGRVEQGNSVFRGIPFAQPPVGALRFLAPEPPAAWDGVRDAAEFGPQCPQASPGIPGTPLPPPDTTGEWLTVNVWTPDPGAGTLPVMVWVHGGGYRAGCGGPDFDGTPFASAGVVFVSLNYRLGVDGWAQVDGVPANRGLLDAVAALRWVRDNIAAFGGDPANVTVFGESAGAGIVASLLAMEPARGLFRRAVIQSLPGVFFSPALAASVTGAIAAAAGVPATRAGLAAADVEELVAAQDTVEAGMREQGGWGAVRGIESPFRPVVDGEVLPRAPWRALVAGDARDVELLIGHNHEESLLSIVRSGRIGRVTEADAELVLRDCTPAPDGAAGYRKAYPDRDAGGLYEVVLSDWLYRMPTLHLAQAHTASGGTTYLYELTAQAPNGQFGSCHALDVPLIFGTYDYGLGALLIGPKAPPGFAALGDLMRREWLSFAAGGNPGWPAYGSQQRATRIYDLQPGIVPYPVEASRHLWERYTFDTLG